MELMRSLLFVPGHRQRMLEKAMKLDLDVTLLDLEDGVPPSEKENARRLVSAALARPSGRAARFVRVNAVDSDFLAGDLRAVVCAGLDGLLLPKVDGPEEVARVDRLLDEREREIGLAPGSVRLVASIESARGLLAAPAIAASSPRLLGLLFGAEDFANDLGLPPRREGEASELGYARSAVVVAAAASGLASFDGVWPDLADADGLRRDALAARRLGFSGKSLIHPAQIEPINTIFSPTSEEVAEARRVIAAYEEAEARGQAAIALEGRLIDAPIVGRARRVLRVDEEVEAARRR